MASFSRLFDIATQALGDSGGRSRSDRARGTDWMGIVRQAAGAVPGAERPARRPSTTPPAAPSNASAQDRAVIARYDYLMQTADPSQIERIHADAFARLTPAQRAQIGARMREELPAHEHPRSDSAGDLARAAGRAEAFQPGRMRGLLGRAGGGAALGAGAVAGGMLAAVAGGAIASAVAMPLLSEAASFGVDFDAMAGGLTDGLGDAVSGLGEQVGGVGEQLSDFGGAGLDDLFG